MAADIERQMADADATLTAAEGQVASAKAKIAALRAYANQAYPHAPWPRTSTRSLLARFRRVHALRWLTGWARLVFMIWTHRVVRLAPGIYLQVQRGTSDARVAASVAAYLRNQKERGKQL